MVQRTLILAILLVSGCTEAPAPAAAPSKSAIVHKDEELYRKGAALLESDPEQAIKYFTQSLELSPNAPPAIYNRAVAYARVGRDAEAVADIDRLEKVEPKLGRNLRAQMALAVAPYTDLGNSEFKAGNFAKAIVKYDSALAYAPGDGDALVGKGLALKNLGQLGQAMECYNKALESEPKSFYAWLNRAALHHHNKALQEALADYTKAIELSPENADSYSGRAAVFADLQQPDEAARDRQKSEELKNKAAKEIEKAP